MPIYLCYAKSNCYCFSTVWNPANAIQTYIHINPTQNLLYGRLDISTFPTYSRGTEKRQMYIIVFYILTYR